MEEEGGSSGKLQQIIMPEKFCQGICFAVSIQQAARSTAGPFSTAAENRNVFLVEGIGLMSFLMN
jgi:hypothetical protein